MGWLGSFVRGPIEVYYTDRCDVYRYEQVENEDGTTETKLSDTPFLEDYACRISYVANRQEDPKDSDVDSNPILTQLKIFISEKSGVRAGDYIFARKMADDEETVIAEYSGPAGLPFAHESHLEFQIGVVTKA